VIIVPTPTGFITGSQARLLDDGSTGLKAWAERHVRSDPDIRWILGNYVEADAPNSNGHIFPLAELQAAQHTLAGKPLNMLHREQHIVGAFAGAQLVDAQGKEWGHSTEVATSMELLTSAENVKTVMPNPYVEAVAGLWHSRFPDEYFEIEKAHKEGSLYLSMEAIPEAVSCPSCQVEAVFAGFESDLYCDHMQGPTGPKILHRPIFAGGAIIIPPVRPGWNRADIRTIAQAHERAEEAYTAMASEMPALEPDQWEWLMAEVVTMAEGREFKTKERENLADKGNALPDGCLSADTEFITMNGIQRIGESVGPVSVLTDVGWADAVIHSYGVKRLVEVVLAGPAGEFVVHATGGHRWPLTDGRWVQTRHLEEGDAIPHVEVGEQALDTHGVDATQCNIARVADNATHPAGPMVVIDHEGRPVTASAVVSTSVPSGASAATTYATLGDKNGVVLHLGDPVLPAEGLVATAVPPLIGDGDALGGCLRPPDDAGPAFSPAAAVPLVEVGVRTLDTAQAADDRTLVVNGETLGLHVSHNTWQVIRVVETSREEEVFCAEVPDLHRFVLANGILTGNSFPIKSPQDVKNAVRAIGRAKDPAAAKAHIKKMARKLGVENLIPADW
jgi:hypothetical protein